MIHVRDPHNFRRACCGGSDGTLQTAQELLESTDAGRYANTCKPCVAYLQGALDSIADTEWRTTPPTEGGSEEDEP